jgi:hypothetical protein
LINRAGVRPQRPDAGRLLAGRRQKLSAARLFSPFFSLAGARRGGRGGVWLALYVARAGLGVRGPCSGWGCGLCVILTGLRWLRFGLFGCSSGSGGVWIVGRPEFYHGFFRLVLRDLLLQDERAFDDVPGRIVLKYAGKDKAIEDGLDGDPVGVGEPVASAQHTDTAW